MSRRESVYVSRRVSFKPRPSPNSTLPAITCELRLFFPPNADADTLTAIMADVMTDATRQLGAALSELGVHHTAKGGVAQR